MSSRKPIADAQRSQADERKARLAAELRANLQKRKAQTRSRRAGAADERDEGLPAAKPADDARKE